MRKIIAIISLMIIGLTSYSQKIDHFSTTDSRWFVANTYPNPDQYHPNFLETKTMIYGFNGDTTLSGKIWKKLYSSYDSTFTTGLNYQGLIRSDTNHVIFVDKDNKTDTIY